MPNIPYANRGMGLENVLDFMHRRYEEAGSAHARHYGISGKWYGRNTFAAFPKSEQPVDYHACVEGRFCVFDAKQTANKTKWSLDKRYLHQLERLRYWSAAGAVAWFAVEATALNVLFLLRVHADENAVPMFGFEDPSSSTLLRVLQHNGLYDWLPAVEENWL